MAGKYPFVQERAEQTQFAGDLQKRLEMRCGTFQIDSAFDVVSRVSQTQDSYADGEFPPRRRRR